MMNIKEGVLLWFTNFLINKPQVVVLITKLNKINNWLKNYTNNLLKKLKKRTVQSGFKGNVWGADLADMQLIIKFNKVFKFYCALLIVLVNMLGLFLRKIKKA